MDLPVKLLVFRIAMGIGVVMPALITVTRVIITLIMIVSRTVMGIGGDRLSLTTVEIVSLEILEKQNV
tara:strand:- start:210 stop:413 length:204 start_codon:yes stop_codon:yes gene_type:complete